MGTHSMNLTSTNDHWLVTMKKCQVSCIAIDYRVALFLCDGSNEASLYIESAFYVGDKEREIQLTPADPLSLQPILTLLHAEVVEITIAKTGKLIARFRDGRFVRVEPDSSYEAWQFAQMGFYLFVCSAGGDVALFQDPSTSGAIRDSLPALPDSSPDSAKDSLS